MLVQLQIPLGKNYNVARKVVDYFYNRGFDTAQLVVLGPKDHALRVQVSGGVASAFCSEVDKRLAARR